VKHRVVITGIGSLTALGSGVSGLWDAIKREKSGLKFITRFDPADYQSRCAGEINDFHPSDFFPPHKLKRLDRYAQFALVITEQALADSKLPYDPAKPTFDYGISFGTALGGISAAELQHERFLTEGSRSIPPALALQVFGGSAHSNIAIAYGFRGYGTTNSNSCASGTVAVGEAFRALRDGYVSAMVAGAAEAPLSPLTYGAFDTIKAMSKETVDASTSCRPFDKTRSGFVMSEGGAAVVMETLEHAQKRGARIYAEVLGYSLNNDAYHMTSSLPDGIAAIAAMEAAMAEAKVKTSDIDYINAHASSTTMNDEHEAKAILKLFGPKTPPVSGTKAYYGHPLGASGAIEAGLCSLALTHGWIPPTLNCHQPDVPEGFDLVRLHGRAQKLNYVLSNSFGFGGINAALVFGKAPQV
jgi:3-oxoacyl-[acyl-carrier-protein] synthase II